MIECGIFSHSVLGEVLVRNNAQAKRFTFRVRDGRLVATVPKGVTMAEFCKVMERMQPRLVAMMKRAPEQKCLAPGNGIDAECFVLNFEEAPVRKPLLRERKGELVCLYPKTCDFTDERMQQWLRNGVEESLRRHAWMLFPERLKALAEARGLSYTGVSVHKAKARWGSCTSNGKINLSLYLMLLPRKLQDYVMQHELTHLQEMNHGPRFHRLLDVAMKGESKQLDKELKTYKLAHWGL